MFKINQDTRNLRSILLLGAASVATIGLCGPALAQDQGATVETVVVTGSRIPQTGLYSASPVTAVGQQEFKLEGTTNVESLLDNLPEVFSNQNSVQGNGSSGTATIDLRHLGNTRTLVLIDGKRLAPGDPTFPLPDLNQIPASLVDHVEVLTGGASAVYGSDAVAGVVNFIMRKDFQGIEVDSQYSVYQHTNDDSTLRAIQAAAGFAQAPANEWDGSTTGATLLMGTNSANDKGNVTVYLNYQNTQAVYGAARDYSACALALADPNTHACQGSSNYNFFQPFNGNNAGNIYFFQPNGTLGNWIQNPQFFNNGAFQTTQRPDTRYGGGAFAHYEVNKQLDVYANLMFTDDDSRFTLAPSAAFAGSGPNNGAFNINCDNPLMTPAERSTLCAGLAPTADVVGDLRRRDVEGGDRIFDYRHTTYRMVVGAKGDFGAGWTYDVYGSYSTSVYQQNQSNQLDSTRIQNALQVVDVGGVPTCKVAVAGTDPTCVPLNIFDGIGGITPAANKYISTTAQILGQVNEQVVSGSLTGDLGAYGVRSPWAKNPVAVSIGSEYRADSLNFTNSDNLVLGTLEGGAGGVQSQPKAGFDVTEGFAELQIPIVEGLPFVEAFTANAGYRYSSYNTSGNVTSYKYGAEWQPIDDVRLRGSYQRAVRAPNVLELFTPDFANLNAPQTDPCAGPVVQQNIVGCERTGLSAPGSGLPNAYGTIQDCPAAQCNILDGGNAALRPEVSDTRSIGVVLTPTFVDGLTATIDYFAILVNKDIGAPDSATIIEQCFNGNQVFCPLIHRNGRGEIFGTGFVTTTNQNLGFEKTKGVDFEAHYLTDLANWGVDGAGSLAFNFIGTWTQRFLIEPFPGLGTFDCAGLYGQNVQCLTPLPSWRHSIRTTWTTPWDFDLSLNWRHMSSVAWGGNSSNPLLNAGVDNQIDGVIPAYDYFDVATAWTVRPGLQLTAGVNNVFDKNPPALSSQGAGATAGTSPANNNTYPGVYDPLGRNIFVSATIKY